MTDRARSPTRCGLKRQKTCHSVHSTAHCCSGLLLIGFEASVQGRVRDVRGCCWLGYVAVDIAVVHLPGNILQKVGRDTALLSNKKRLLVCSCSCNRTVVVQTANQLPRACWTDMYGC